jgi:hypothetical protein
VACSASNATNVPAASVSATTLNPTTAKTDVKPINWRRGKRGLGIKKGILALGLFDKSNV